MNGATGDQGGRTVLRGLEPILGLLVTVVSALAFAPFYAGWWWLAAVGGAVVLGGLLVALGLYRGWPWPVHLLLGLVAFGVFAFVTGYLNLLRVGPLEALRALGVGVLTAVPKMLTVGLPADTSGDLLLLPTALAWLAGAAVVALALRTTTVTGLAAPPVLVFVAGLLFTAARPQPRLLVTGVVLLGVLGLLLLRSNRVAAADREGIAAQDADAVGLDLAARRWHSTLGRVAFGLPAIVGISVLAVLDAGLQPLATGANRADLRELHRQTVTLTDTLSPLVLVRPQLNGPRTPLFTVAVQAAGGNYQPDRVRVAALDVYDGALWSQSRDFEVVGSTLPGREPLPADAVRVSLDVTVERLPQPFLPTVGEPVSFTGTDVAFDRGNSTVITTRPATTGLRYQTSGEVRPQNAEIRAAQVSATPADVANTRLPADLPAWLPQLADQVIQDRQTAMSQLLAIETYLRNQSYTPQGLPGHSYGALRRVLLGAPADRAGYAEQYAAAFAVLARYLGFPARVAVGYQLRPEQRAGDRYSVFSTDAHAWPEVHLAGYGWVPFEPTDARGPAVAPPPRSPDVTLGAADSDRPVDPQRADTGAGAEGGVADLVTRGGLVVGGLFAVVVLLGGLVVLLKTMRRGRRARRGTPGQRVGAAWIEVVDRLRDAGVRVPDSQTGAEVAGAVANGPAGLAARSLEKLAPVVADAAFAPWEPTEAAAQLAWSLATQIRSELDAVLPLPQRLRALVDPRPLLPRRRRRVPVAAASSDVVRAGR